MEFVVDGGHVMEAHGVDLSDAGIGFESDTPLEVALTVTSNGHEMTRIARLVRVRAKEDGGFLFGLEFVKAVGE